MKSALAKGSAQAMRRHRPCGRRKPTNRHEYRIAGRGRVAECHAGHGVATRRCRPRGPVGHGPPQPLDRRKPLGRDLRHFHPCTTRAGSQRIGGVAIAVVGHQRVLQDMVHLAHVAHGTGVLGAAALGPLGPVVAGHHAEIWLPMCSLAGQFRWNRTAKGTALGNTGASRGDGQQAGVKKRVGCSFEAPIDHSLRRFLELCLSLRTPERHGRLGSQLRRVALCGFRRFSSDSVPEPFRTEQPWLAQILTIIGAVYRDGHDRGAHRIRASLRRRCAERAPHGDAGGRSRGAAKEQLASWSAARATQWAPQRRLERSGARVARRAAIGRRSEQRPNHGLHCLGQSSFRKLGVRRPISSRLRPSWAKIHPTPAKSGPSSAKSPGR